MNSGGFFYCDSFLVTYLTTYLTEPLVANVSTVFKLLVKLVIAFGISLSMTMIGQPDVKIQSFYSLPWDTCMSTQ